MIRRLMMLISRRSRTRKILQKIRDGVHSEVCGKCSAYHCSNECVADIRAMYIMHDIWKLENLWGIKERTKK